MALNSIAKRKQEQCENIKSQNVISRVQLLMILDLGPFVGFAPFSTPVHTFSFTFSICPLLICGVLVAVFGGAHTELQIPDRA